MQIDPQMGAGQVLQDGLTYFNGLVGEIQAGEQFTIHLQYEKPDDTLSQNFEAVFPSEPIESQTSFNNIWPWIVGGAGLLMMLGVAIWYLKPQPRPADAQGHKRHAAPAGQKQTGKEGVFCHNCGARSQAGDAFCRTCGTKLRQ